MIDHTIIYSFKENSAVPLRCPLSMNVAELVVNTKSPEQMKFYIATITSPPKNICIICLPKCKLPLLFK